MSIRMASDEVTDDIAAIEMHRQGTEQESGLAAACNEALRKLQALLEREKESLQLHGPDSVYAANVEAVANHIKRVQSMLNGRGHGAKSKNARPKGARPMPRADKPRSPARNRGRRPMGRGGRRGGGAPGVR